MLPRHFLKLDGLRWSLGLFWDYTAEWLLGVQLRHFSLSPLQYIWRIMGSGGSLVIEHCLHNPGVLGSIPGSCRPFHYLYFHLKTSYSNMRQEF